MRTLTAQQRRWRKAEPGAAISNDYWCSQEPGRSSFLFATSTGIEAADNYVWIYAGGARHLLRAGLASFGERLDPREFTRIHPSTIVRTTLIAELRTRIGGRSEAVLTNGIRLAVSRGYRDAVRQRVRRGR